MRNLRNKTEDHRGREEKIKQDKIRGETNHKRLLIIGKSLRNAGRRQMQAWGKWVMDIKEGM